MPSKYYQNDSRLHLKRTSKQSQELQMVQIAFKIQSKRFEVAPQTHLKAISRTSTARIARHTALKEGFAPSMFTTSSHTSRMAIPSSTWSCHARAASVGCRPRGCTVTCTVGMASGWRCGDGTVCGFKKMRLQFGVNSDYDPCLNVHSLTTNTRDSKLFDPH